MSWGSNAHGSPGVRRQLIQCAKPLTDRGIPFSSEELFFLLKQEAKSEQSMYAAIVRDPSQLTHPPRIIHCIHNPPRSNEVDLNMAAGMLCVT